MTVAEQAVSTRRGDDLFDVASLLRDTGQASYCWDIATDELVWSENFADLVGIRNGMPIGSGRSFETLLSGDGGESRFGIVFAGADGSPRATGERTAYQCCYAIAAEHSRNGEEVWLEDTGIWHADARGRPVRAQGVVRVISERRKREETLRRKSDFDDLTGLPNRRYLEMKIGEAAQACLAEGEEAAFVLVEISHLDTVNDIYGFVSGDEVLEKAGRRLETMLRGTDLVGRFSGARFGLILQRCKVEEIYPAMQRFAGVLEHEILQASAGPVALQPILGGCSIPRHAHDARGAIACATEALREARRDPTARFNVYEPNEVQNRARDRDRDTVRQLIEAFERGSIRLAFQPVVHAHSRAVAFHEALLRVENSNGEIIDAGSFMPLAEGLGFIGLLDGAAAEMAIDKLRHHEDAVISVNVSNETIEDRQWLSRLASLLASAGGVGERLIVEITESHVAADLGESRKLVHLLKDMGCRIAIDDFGAGYTSFANLRALPVDIIKIDGSFARDLTTSEANRVFIQSLVTLARSCGAKTVVEWVDTKDDAELLLDWGVDFFQGNLFGAASVCDPWQTAASIGNREDLVRMAASQTPRAGAA